MIEKIIQWSADNRFIVILIYVIVIGFGIYSVVNLPVDAIPDLSEKPSHNFHGMDGTIPSNY